MATEVPREKLKELMEKNGDSLLQDRDRCEGLLKDYCGGHRREISALVGALEERVPLELKSSWQTAMTPEAMRARLVQRLEDNRGLAPEIANYAVDTWSYALGVGLGRSSDRVQDVPVSNGVAVGLTAAERAAADRPAGSVPSVAPCPPVVVKAGMSNQNKAVVGGVGLLAVAAVAFALLHHPQPTAPPNNNPPVQNGQNQNGQNGQTPVPPVQDGQNKVPPVQQGHNGTNPVVDSGNSTTHQQTRSSSAMAAGDIGRGAPRQ